MADVFNAPETVRAAVVDGRSFPVHRIYCVGRNYAEHVAEMGGDAERDPPLFFSKPADALVGNDSDIPYPPRSENFHHEVELVVALGSGGCNLSLEQAQTSVFGYAVGNDLTRRDLQGLAKSGGQPWDVAKGFDFSAPMSALTPVQHAPAMNSGEIYLKVNGEIRQQGDLSQLIWSVPEMVAELSTLFTLQAGDLIFTGTPAGVGPLQIGDQIEAGIAGLETLRHRIV
jgi:fumarylpyruvate hydrolase